jgi:hypothetical protein
MLRSVGLFVVIGWALCAADPAQAAFSVVMQHESTNPADWVVGGTVDNTDEAALLMLNGGIAEGTDAPDVIHYGPIDEGFTDFPGGMNNHMAMRAEGLIDIVGGGDSLIGVVLTVTSDDGFRLLLNGNVVAEHATLRTTDSTSTAPLTLNDGDFLSLLYFNGPGEGDVALNIGSSSGPLVGFAESGMSIVAVPEPGCAMPAALLAAAAAAAPGLRRGRRHT